jgi:hypothetical protein
MRFLRIEEIEIYLSNAYVDYAAIFAGETVVKQRAGCN